MEQRTPEWFAARLGKVTASRVADIIAKTKTGYSTSRANYAAQLICERLTGEQAETFTNAAMQWGTEKEPDALAYYAFAHDADVDPVGFVDHPAIAMSGASPDGLVRADGLVEVKCPITATHLDTLIGETVPTKYLPQMHWQMACTGRAWCDFVSFDPRLPADMRLFVKRVHRDDALIGDLETEVRAFLAEIDQRLADLQSAAARRAGTSLTSARVAAE